VLNAITVILAAILLNTGVWVDIAATGVSAAGIADAVRWTNFGVKIFLVLTVVMAIGDAIPEGLRLFRKKTSWNYSIAT
jgi:purine-cytosine permease-like protein